MVYHDQLEVDKIQQEYTRRDALENKEYNLLYAPSSHLVKFRRGYEISKMLRLNFPDGLTDKNILDVGCGTGSFLQDLRNMGARDQNLNGIDLSDERVEAAKTQYPAMNFIKGSGELPFDEKSFDIVSAFTVFSSILDDGFRQFLAEEMVKVTKDGGIILIYDFVYDNPKNNKVRAFTMSQIRSLFPDYEIKSVRLTLAPPISRRISKLSITLAYMLEIIFPFLRTHRIFLIKKNIR